MLKPLFVGFRKVGAITIWFLFSFGVLLAQSYLEPQIITGGAYGNFGDVVETANNYKNGDDLISQTKEMLKNTSLKTEAGHYQKLLLGERVARLAKPTRYEDGFLFTYAGKKEDVVYLSGSFFNWTKRVRLVSNEYGVFQVFVPMELLKGVYTYRFLVNHVWQNDP